MKRDDKQRVRAGMSRSATPWLAIAWLLSAHANAAAPALDDYAQGITITSPREQPLVGLDVPDTVYRTITSANLADVRVFNADGAAVPHAFCAAPETSAPIVEKHSLQIFQLQEALRTSAGAAQIEVETSGGTQVRVQQSEANAVSESRPSVHILDARGVDRELRAIEFDWSSPDGASEATVRIQASDDLNRWSNIVASSTLLQVVGEGRPLGRKRIELPQRRYEYLRVERADGGAPLQIRSALAESITGGAVVEPMWFTAESTITREPGVRTFDAGRMAPVQFARLRWPHQNNAVRFDLASRRDDNSTWHERWRGESYSIVTEREVRKSPPARFDATTDRYWRVRLPSDVALSPILELGYRAAKLKFLAQGPGPYTLAFGSRRAEPASPASCEGLLADVEPSERARLLAEGHAGALRTLGGEVALTPTPQRTSVRLVVLWAVLIGGVAVLIAMALSLLRRLKAPAE